MLGIFLSYVIFSAAQSAEDDYKACQLDTTRYESRSEEIKQIVKADQADRINGQMLPGTSARDVLRRMRIGAIFGEGCFKSAEDFEAAALVFQHGGDVNFNPKTLEFRALAPDHILQAFLWAKKAADLKSESAKWLTAAAADRYLWYTGHKQLFGTQAFGTSANACLCLVPIESAFPDTIRLQYTGRTYAQALDHLREFPNQGPQCKPSFCALPLQPSPAGSLPGFW